MSGARVRGPSGHGASEGEITVRRMDLEFPESMPTFWFDGNPFLTAMLASLSAAFPPGERFFIHSVRHYLPGIEDPELQQRARAFIGQEANHTKEHIAFNRFLDASGFPAKSMEEYATRGIQALQERSKPEWNLARTAALEHFTAIMAGAMLEHPELLERMSPHAATLWAWHAIEEIEHRSVAFDVYQRAVGDDGLRRRVMAITTLLFVGITSVRTLLMMRATGTLFDVRATARGLNLLWGRPGVFRKLLPHYFAYYRRDFHPSQHDHRAQVDAAKRRYLGEAPAGAVA